MLVHVSYPYHAYLESRPKAKNSCWIEHEKTFCNIFITYVHREKIPGFASEKAKQKTFDWFSHFKHVFVSLARPSYSIKKKSAQHLFIKLKLIKMNAWMSELFSDTKLSILWTKFDFQLQVGVFMKLPDSFFWIFCFSSKLSYHS